MTRLTIPLCTALCTCMFSVLEAAPRTDFPGTATDRAPKREARIAARTERHRLDGKENNVFLTFLSTGVTGHGQGMVRLKLEYSRQIRGNLYWGCSASAMTTAGYLWEGDGFEPGGCSYNNFSQDIFKFDGMAFYRLPVIRSRLLFRVGAGVGVGIHRILDYEELFRNDCRLLPYLNIEAAWILRCAKGFELKFSPTVLLVPSEFSVSPVKLGGPTHKIPWFTDAGLSLTLGWRF